MKLHTMLLAGLLNLPDWRDSGKLSVAPFVGRERNNYWPLVEGPVGNFLSAIEKGMTCWEILTGLLDVQSKA